MTLLRGLPVATAQKFGMPCLGCEYTGDGAHCYRLLDGARCAVCGRPATNCHHEPHLGMGGGNASFRLHGAELRPALIALCGSGTTGCHGLVHSGRIGLEWRWDAPWMGDAWWHGSMLDAAGTDALLAMGHWAVIDGGGERWALR